MTRTRFNNKNGDLTLYAFACGYIETFEESDDPVEPTRGTLSMDSPGAYVFHLKGFDHGKRFWLTFNRLTPARKAFKTARKMARKGQPFLATLPTGHDS